MKKNLKNSWLKNNLFQLNIWTILLYGLSFWLSSKLNFNLPIYIIGTFYLLFLTPYNILILTSLAKKTNFAEEAILMPITIFFGLLTPLYFVLNYFFKIPFSFNLVLIFNLIISIIIILKNKSSHLFSLQINPTSWIKTFKKYWPIWLIFIIYLLLHAINYHFYIFMPEWDGYTKLIEIKNAITLNELETNYRGFFTVAVIIIQKFTYLPAYQVFTKLLILLQFIPILVVYLFLQRAKIKSRLYQFIVLLTTVSIPVLNMEIDYPRPQIIFIILAPVFVYLLYQALRTNTFFYWLLAGFIALFGLNYHEFFLFLFLAYSLALLISVTKKYYILTSDKKDKFIFKLIFFILILLAIILLEHTPFLTYLMNVFKNILSQISRTERWRWWFLNNYSADGSNSQLGWPGVGGAVKYYSYYASPVILFILSILLVLIINKKIKLTLLYYLIVPIILLLLTYNEILPRLNYIYLPERIWLIIDLLLLLLLPALLNTIKKYFSQKILQSFLFLITVLSVIGIAGSLFIAKNKASLTSKNEYTTAQWIKDNTPGNSLFISQPANGPMVKYFAERDLIPNSFNIFNTENTTTPEVAPTKDLIKKKILTIDTRLETASINNLSELNLIIRDLQQQKKILQNLHKKKYLENRLGKHYADAPIYALYSKDKFKGLYAQREWWLKTNFYNAPINKLTKKYPLVYNENGIYIWKIK